MSLHHYWCKNNRGHVIDCMFHRMSIDTHDSCWCCPFMVSLVEMFVEERKMK